MVESAARKVDHLLATVTQYGQQQGGRAAVDVAGPHHCRLAGQPEYIVYELVQSDLGVADAARQQMLSTGDDHHAMVCRLADIDTCPNPVRHSATLLSADRTKGRRLADGIH